MDSLLVERADGVVTCTLNRPDKKNAITGEMWSGLIELFEAVATIRRCVLVITNG
jgi:enoyl-CoA hydratase/carnithine racemase